MSSEPVGRRPNPEKDVRVCLLSASIRELQQLIDGISTSSSSSSSSSPVVVVPSHLANLIHQSAIQEELSTLSKETYELVVQEMASFMSSTIASFGKSFESEGLYNPELLNMYDALVWGFNSPFLWRITQRDITSLYRSNLSRNNHCEIAVGTGLFLTNDMMLSSMNKITLLDLNDNCLRVCEERIKDVCNRTDASSLPAVSKLLVNIMTPTRRTTTTTNDDGNEVIDPPPATPLTSMCGKFQSVGANFLFHCLHGSSLYDKIDSFRNCASLLDPIDGVFFGSTILGKEMLDDEMNAGETAMHVLRQFNNVGVFGNMGDSFQDLKDILTEVFEDVDLNRIGYCGVWTARHPRI